jgi:hypothetical protein
VLLGSASDVLTGIAWELVSADARDDQISRLRIKAGLSADHACPDCLRSRELSRMNQRGSSVGGTGMQRQPFSISGSSALNGMTASRVMTRSSHL